MKTKLPTAIVYNWNKLGRFLLSNQLYTEDNLRDDVLVFSLGDYSNFDDETLEKQKINYKADTIIIVESSTLSEQQLADLVLVESHKSICYHKQPTFSIFTPIYNTGEKIIRTYNSLKNQNFNDWEWIVLDDSIEDNTWKIVDNLSKTDSRIKLHKIFPVSGGNIGLVKNRAASLCNGKWLVELDHDDALFPDCLLECLNASKVYPDAEFIYSDFCSRYEDGSMIHYDHETSGNWYARPDNRYVFGYSGNVWEEHYGEKYLRHYHCEINPLTIRFNIGMPNHVRIWKRDFYNRIGGHNKNLPVADDFELIIRTFLNTRIIHVRKMLYVQWNNGNSTVDNNSIDINRRARVIRDLYDSDIHNRIVEMGYQDWNWDENSGQSIRKILNTYSEKKYYQEENVLNYIYE